MASSDVSTLEMRADIPAEPVPEASGETQDGARISEPPESASE